MPQASDQLETLAESEDDAERAGLGLRGDEPPVPGLVVLWSMDEPACVGAWLPVSPSPAARAHVFGRGPSRQDDEHPRLLAYRQRPDGNHSLEPLQSQSLSRSQLLVQAALPELLELVNVGRRRLLVNGTEVERAQVRPGDVIEIGAQLALLCVTRPRRFGASPAWSDHAFGEPDRHGFVGESAAAWKLRAEVAFAARRTGHVLVLGATGTGKELVARALHAASNRTGPLVARNAATLPESLVDAELFGNLKGYPNPGMPDRRGLIGAADGGSLFLDEFADLPAAAQAHVLRVLDGGEYHRLGEDTARRSQFRLIAATNRPASALRTDVLARFDFRLATPDLAARREDVPLLARHLLRIMADDDPELKQRFFADGVPRLSLQLVRRLVRREYTANVRELRHLLWRALAGSAGNILEWADARPAGDEGELPASSDAPIDREQLQRALDENNGSLEKTWRALGLANRHVLSRLVRKHGLSVTKQPRS